MRDVPVVPADHPDRLRWNARYRDRPDAPLDVHPLVARALSSPLPDGPVLDLACGISPGTLLATAAGRRVTAVDVSDVALGLLEGAARRLGRRADVTLIQADLRRWRPEPGRYAAVLCVGYWDRDVFGPAADAVRPGGVLAWEAFTADARRVRPGLPAEWCLNPGEPASLLPAGFAVLDQHDLPDARKRRLLARRAQNA